MPFMCCCTAYTDKSFQDKVLEAGIQKFVNKPMHSDVLDDILTNLK